uniref:DH domain-containing protein n=1 Tax=Haemonchus contortus TaxID=6289 RepID=A0A7I4Y770_HAECO|nr:Dbl homology (DH) domain containing protein [Haemonchus contortus]
MFGSRKAVRFLDPPCRVTKVEVVQITRTRMYTALVSPWGGSPSILEETCVEDVKEARIVDCGYMTACDSIAETMLSPGVTDEKFKICQEIYSTERNYIDNLKLLLKVKDVLLERVAKNKPVMEEATIKQIFGKIKAIVDVHQRIIAELEDLIEHFDKKGQNIAEIWKSFSYELLRIYPGYTNYCDTARSIFVDACENNPKLKVFIESLEREPEFHRQRVADIMMFPVQRLAGVKLLLEKLQRKSKGGQSAEIQRAIDKVGDVLSQSNTVRLNSDKYIASLNLLAQVDSIPVNLISSSNDVIISMEARLVCASNRVDIKDNREISLVLFSNGSVMVSKKIRRLGNNTVIGKAVWRNVFNTLKKSYKFKMTLVAEQFRCMNFVYCRRKAKVKDGPPLPLERTPYCCWKIREERGDVDWIVEVNAVEMEVFAACLLEVLISKIGNVGGRSLKMNTKMTITEVSLECQAVLKKKLLEKGYSTEEEEEQEEEEGKVSKFSSLLAKTVRWGAVSGVFSTALSSPKQHSRPPELQDAQDMLVRMGQRKSIVIRPRLIYPLEEAV